MTKKIKREVKNKNLRKNKIEKEAETLSVNSYIKGDIEITETAKLLTADTEVLTTPWGTKVNANDISTVLEEYYSLSNEDREKEKVAWVELISKMMGQADDGLKIVDIELANNGSRQVKFIYRQVE